METHENAIEDFDKQIPELAVAATRKAFWQALASGNSVLVSKNGIISEAFPDGTVKFIKKGEPFIKVEKEKIIRINKSK